MTSPSEHVSTVSGYYEAFENVGLYDKKNGNLIKSEIDQQVINENEKRKDSTLSNSPKLIDSTCCNSERANIVDASTSSFSNEDYGKDHTHKDNNMNTEMDEHENNETSIFSGNECADLEVDQTNHDIRSFIDAILENISLVRNELVDGDLNQNNREKSETHSQELSILAGSLEEGQVKTDNNCDVFKTAINSDEKPDYINVRELYFSVKPLNTEISNLGEQSEDVCFNSEKGREIDISIKVVAIDTEKVDETSQEIESAKFENEKQENFVDIVKCGSNCFISGNRGVKEVTVDTDPEIFNLAKKETNPTHDSISVCNRERSDEASQGSYTLGRRFEDDERENCKTFEGKATSCLDEIQGDFNKLENIEINNFGKKNIEECCSSENGSFNLEDIDIPSKNILIDHGRAEEKFGAANNAECEAQKDETIENNVSSVKNDKLIELHDDIYSIVDMNVKKLNLIKMEIVPILDYPNPSIREKMEVVGKKLNELVENLENMELKVGHNSVLGLNHGISEDIKTVDVEINDSCMQNIDGFCDSEKDNSNSDINGTSLKVIATKDREKMDSNDVADNAISETYEDQNIEDNGGCSCSYNGKEVCETNDDLKLCHPQLKSSEKKSELKENNDDVIANNSGKSEPVIQESFILHGITEKNKTRDNIYVTIESKEDGKHEISMRVLDTDKQDADVFKSSEDDCLNSNVNVKIILTEDHKQKELSKTLKQQKSTDCNEKNCFNGEVSEISDKISSCLDPVVENVNVTERENEIVNNGVTVNIREKCKKVSQKFSILRNNIRNEERRKEKTLEVTSKIETFPEDLDVIVISSTEEVEDDDTFNEMNGENDLNTDVLPSDKFHEELDNEIEVLKAQYSDIENKLSTAKNISDEEKYKCCLKVKKELTFFMQSLEKLRVSFRNKLLQDKSKISKEQVKPSCSYHVQPQEKVTENPIDKYRIRSQAFTRLTKIESHHHYEYKSQMPPWETVKTSHKCKKRPEDFSASEEETCKNLHKKQCISQYSYERAFPQSPEKKNKSCSKRSNCTSYRKARETEFHSYSNELDCFGGRGGFSKSFIAHRELLFSKSNPRNYTNYLSHSNPSPSNQYKSSVLRPCSRKKVSERLYEKGLNLHKYGREHDFKDALSDSSEISSVSDREFSPIHSDPYFTHGKYCKNKHAKSVKRNDLSPRREKSRKIKEKPHEMDEISMSSTDSNTSIEVIEASEKRRKDKACKHNIENKRVHNLMGRQMDFINNHVSKKGDRIEPTQASFNDSNIDEKWKQGYYDKEKNKEEMSSSEGTTSALEKTKKRKKKVYELPFKQVKISHHSDLRNILNNKYQNENSKVKFHSHISSRSRSMSPVETNIRSPCKRKLHTDGQNISKNKYNTENCKVKLQSYIVSPSYNLPVSENKNKNKDIDNYSTQFFGEQTKETKRQKNKTIGSLSTQSLAEQRTERNERKTNRPDDKHIHKIFDNVAQSRRNEACEEQSEGEMNNIKGIESYVSFLKKKKGKYLTPPFTMLINQQLEKEREPKFGSDSIDEVKRESKFQKSRTNLVYPENVPFKSKKTVRSPQISPKMAEQSVTLKPVKKEFEENKNEVPAPSGKFDLFKELNRKIRKKKVKKSAPATSTIDADFENQKAFSKPIYPADDDDASFNKVKGFSTKFEGREYSTKSKDLIPDFQEDNGTWSD